MCLPSAYAYIRIALVPTDVLIGHIDVVGVKFTVPERMILRLLSESKLLNTIS